MDNMRTSGAVGVKKNLATNPFADLIESKSDR
jgi:hypothetical protein